MFFFIAEFEREAKIKEDHRLPFLNISSSFRVITVKDEQLRIKKWSKKL